MSKKGFVTIIGVLAVVIMALTGWAIGGAEENETVKCWILCKPGSQVNVRRTPSKKSEQVGYLEVGDWFRTNGESKNGYIRCYDIGEYGEGWIYSGYVVTEEPVQVYEQYVCVAKKRVACRKWIGGPQTSMPWLKNGSDVSVFYIADGWAITSRGYIQSEWLEANPR